MATTILQLSGKVGAGRQVIIPTKWESEILKWSWTLKRCKIKPGVRSHLKEYVQGSVNGQLYLLHRYIMELEHGPSEMQVDHRDNDGLDNSLENLRYVTRRGNGQGAKMKRFGRGEEDIGLTWNESQQNWRVKWRDSEGKQKTRYFTVYQYETKERAKEEARLLNTQIRDPMTGSYKIIQLPVI